MQSADTSAACGVRLNLDTLQGTIQLETQKIVMELGSYGEMALHVIPQ
jgi:hypothetical protein